MIMGQETIEATLAYKSYCETLARALEVQVERDQELADHLEDKEERDAQSEKEREQRDRQAPFGVPAAATAKATGTTLDLWREAKDQVAGQLNQLQAKLRQTGDP